MPVTAEQQCDILRRELVELKLVLVDKDNAMEALVRQRDKAEANVNKLEAQLEQIGTELRRTRHSLELTDDAWARTVKELQAEVARLKGLSTT